MKSEEKEGIKKRETKEEKVEKESNKDNCSMCKTQMIS
jgi:hypothetical protein